ncbi:twin transmembrane helix small protein [uncultured Brevundimonas sp.]|uniref:twin transmembrane helix small protein n=1 Tax=uncultured Brevundimonas sp. TaxID=213418 RepID=UPI0026288246|nr:twin transmembrane helix small protein [uncultured Brevundimonas sp.]
MTLIDILILAAILAVTITLAMGIFGLYRNSDDSRNRSNKLMRLRVVLQAVAIVLLVVGMAIKKSHLA